MKLDLDFNTSGINIFMKAGHLVDLFYSTLLDEIVDREPGVMGVPDTVSTSQVNAYQDWVKSLASAVEDGDVNRIINNVKQAPEIAKIMGTTVSYEAIERPAEIAVGYLSFLNRASKMSGEDLDNYIETCKKEAKRNAERFINLIERFHELDSVIEEMKDEIGEVVSSSVNRMVNAVAGIKDKVVMVREYGDLTGDDKYRAVKSALNSAKNSLINL